MLIWFYNLQDPSVQKAVAGTQPANLDDYNPFDKNNPSVSGGSSAPPQSSVAPPPTYESTRPPQISAEDFEVCINMTV